MSELKLCKDCKHYRPGAYAYGVSCEAACLHPENMETCPVSGGRVFKNGGNAATPLYQRKQGGCGMDAKRFEQAPPPEPPPRNPGPSNLGPMPTEESLGFWDSIAAVFK